MIFCVCAQARLNHLWGSQFKAAAPRSPIWVGNLETHSYKDTKHHHHNSFAHPSLGSVYTVKFELMPLGGGSCGVQDWHALDTDLGSLLKCFASALPLPCLLTFSAGERSESATQIDSDLSCHSHALSLRPDAAAHRPGTPCLETIPVKNRRIWRPFGWDEPSSLSLMFHLYFIRHVRPLMLREKLEWVLELGNRAAVAMELQHFFTLVSF